MAVKEQYQCVRLYCPKCGGEVDGEQGYHYDFSSPEGLARDDYFRMVCPNCTWHKRYVSTEKMVEELKDPPGGTNDQ